MATKIEEDKMLMHTKGALNILVSFSYFARALIILFLLGLVAYGWKSTGKKFFSHQSYVATTVNETDRFTYPSLTFCKKFKAELNLVSLLRNKSIELGVDNLADMDMQTIIANISFMRTDFLSFFYHPDPDALEGADDEDLLHIDALWRSSIPHPMNSGACHTYTPSFQSRVMPGQGIRFGIRFAGSENYTQAKKEKLLSSVNIFLHDRDSFVYFEQDDRPSCSKLDVSWFRYGKEIPINLRYSRFTSLGSEKYPCSEDPNFSFGNCVDNYFLNSRGCQAPWNPPLPSSPLPLCMNVEEMAEKFRQPETTGSTIEQDWTRPGWSTSGLAITTGCPVACTSSKYKGTLSFKSLSNDTKEAADWVVSLYFKNFRFRYDEEILVCDWTCLLGEIGGNLGFFIGGSVLAYADFVVMPLIDYLGD